MSDDTSAQNASGLPVTRAVLRRHVPLSYVNLRVVGHAQAQECLDAIDLVGHVVNSVSRCPSSLSPGRAPTNLHRVRTFQELFNVVLLRSQAEPKPPMRMTAWFCDGTEVPQHH